jgi:hypothetical protein
MTERPGPKDGTAEPAVPATPPRDPLLDRVAFVSAEAAQVMAAVDSETENFRNLLYRLAQANLTLSEVVAELLRRGAGEDTPS